MDIFRPNHVTQKGENSWSIIIFNLNAIMHLYHKSNGNEKQEINTNVFRNESSASQNNFFTDQ